MLVLHLVVGTVRKGFGDVYDNHLHLGTVGRSRCWCIRQRCPKTGTVTLWCQ